MQENLFSRLANLGKRAILYGILVICFLLFFIYYFFYQTPNTFKPDTTVRIEGGQSLMSITKSLKSEGIVSSPFWLENLVILMGGERKVVAGYYLFHDPQNLFKVARRITKGDYEIVPIKVTIPEGLNIKEISATLGSRLNLFNSNEFLEQTKDKEGYLFPETYFFVPTILSSDIVSRLESTFDQKISPLRGEIASSGRSLDDIIKMASILEGEAKKTEDRKIIAGILWKRISLGIPLQVDTTFKYINGKTSAELTASDLKISSPYNTYKNKGLPPTPISNPGLDTIMAALEPMQTNYLYFLSDKNGEIHYAKTLKEHAINRAKFL
jgi:UPF0755 protein